jgi:putative holliday junction resolvase
MVIPFGVVSDINEVVKVIKDEDIDKIVIGKPISLNNKELFMFKKVEKFSDLLEKNTKKEIIMHDERLSSKAADNLPGDKKNKALRDAIAAMLILESFLQTKLNS